ncbi:PilZ domain-containing protein [Gammaproteobacteria bacterium]
MIFPRSPNIDTERRNYYRIDDSALLAYQIIPAEQLDYILARFYEGKFGQFIFNGDFIENDNDAVMADALASIRVAQPTVAIYLEALDRKINLLSNFFMMRNKEIVDYPIRRINLSGGGIAFDVEQEIPFGNTMELKMVLLPRYNGVLAYATVVHCHKRENSNHHDYRLPWRVALNFSHIREIDRDIIIRHVLYQQATQLRRRLHDRESIQRNVLDE